MRAALENVDLGSLVIVHATLSCAVFVYAAQCARPLALDVRRWLRARGH